VIKRYHAPSTPYERALAHPKVPATVKQRLREQYRTLDPVALLAEIRATQEELGNRVDRRAGKNTILQPAQSQVPPDAVDFANTLGATVKADDPRATHRRPKRRYKARVRMPSKLDPHVGTIEAWLAAEPQLTAIAIVGRLSETHPDQFGTKQHSIVQRLLKGSEGECCREAHCSRATWRHNRCPWARGCGRLGLWRAPTRPQPLPSSEPGKPPGPTDPSKSHRHHR